MTEAYIQLFLIGISSFIMYYCLSHKIFHAEKEFFIAIIPLIIVFSTGLLFVNLKSCIVLGTSILVVVGIILSNNDRISKIIYSIFGGLIVSIITCYIVYGFSLIIVLSRILKTNE